MRVWDLKFQKEILIKTSHYKMDWSKSVSKEQKIIQDFLYPYWNKYIVLREVRIPSSLLRLDLVCATNRTVIEYSPTSHHGTFNKFFHKNRSNYGRSLERDKDKYDWITDPRNNLKFLELNEKDLPYLSIKYIQEKFDISII